MTGPEPRPVLWQLELSHYNEKVRWALDFKRVDHVRRPLLPGAHLLIARRLTNGACETTPVLTLQDTSIGESSQIIAALERRWPEPALYPADEGERTRALELEALCDIEVGEHLRRAAYEHLLVRPDLLLPSFVHNQPPLARALLRGIFPALRAGMRRRFRITPENAAESRARVLAVVDLLERELADGGGEYLVGDRFSVADLTAAALLYPIARPTAFPYPIPEVPAAAQEFMDSLANRPIGAWVTSMYERHRAAPGVRRTLSVGGR
ncbi:MAG TPA: glutathione S-transferase family protein [Solirubrobacteraceae bacterium]|nr:glutathione S-transferase family protein [Solirubrobacteraceae bacterium]